MNRGKNFRGEQIIDEAFFDDLVTPNKMLKDAFQEQYKFIAPNGNYRSQFWVAHAEKKQFMMIGVYGQFAYFDYENEFSVVGFGSYPIAKDALLVASLGVMMDAMLGALKVDQATAKPSLNILKTIGR